MKIRKSFTFIKHHNKTISRAHSGLLAF